MSIGEYDPDGSKAKAEYRRSFLEAIWTHELETHSPESSRYSRPCRVLKELSGVPFQHYKSFYSSPTNRLAPGSVRWNAFIAPEWNEMFRGGLLSQINTLLGLRPLQDVTPDHYFAWLALRKSIVEWAGRWNLNSWENDDHWFFDQTLETLYWWYADQQALDKLVWELPNPTWKLPLNAPPPPLGLPTWGSDTERQAEYIERVRRDALHQIEGSILSCSEPSSRKAFIDSIEKKAAEYCKSVQMHYGWEKSRDKPERQKHITWAMRFQVLGDSYSGIAKSEHTNAPHVQRAVAEILGILKLIPRKNPSGRKLGQKDASDTPRQSKKMRKR